MNPVWLQNCDPLGNPLLSTLAAAVPVVTLFFFLTVVRSAAWKAAVYALLAAILVALLVFRMPASMAAGAVASGVVFGWFRIAWVVVTSVFVYDVSVESGQFEIIKESISDISGDRRMQVLLVAFAFGALLEGVGGGGAPVAVCGAMMIGLGFPPFQTAVLCLIANTLPVPYGTLGNPVRILSAVTGLGQPDFSAMIGRILPLVALILPLWLVRVICNRHDTLAVWPGWVAAGVSFAGMQFFWSNYIDDSLVDIVGGVGTLLLLAFLLRMIWRPKVSKAYTSLAGQKPARPMLTAGTVLRGWLPFLLLTAFVVLWTLPPVTRILSQLSWSAPVPGLDMRVVRTPPVVPKPYAEPALFEAPWLSTAGTGIFLAGLLAGMLGGLSLKRTLRVFAGSMARLAWSMVAILAMLGIGYLTRYCGMDATLGMAMAHTGALFPFFGTMIGWVGVGLSGTVAGSNALFGSFQMITANKLGLSPILMGAANSAGGVMGKLIAAQSLVIACAVTGQEGQEGLLFRAMLKHSLALAGLVGLIVLVYAYVFPGAVPSGHHFW